MLVLGEGSDILQLFCDKLFNVFSSFVLYVFWEVFRTGKRRIYLRMTIRDNRMRIGISNLGMALGSHKIVWSRTKYYHFKKNKVDSELV